VAYIVSHYALKMRRACRLTSNRVCVNAISICDFLAPGCCTKRAFNAMVALHAQAVR
jgi:hypothetical protein